MKQIDSIGKDYVKYICLNCHMIEWFPKVIVDYMDSQDIEFDSENPPQFRCDNCKGEMYPKYYKNQKGKEFRMPENS